MNTPKDSITFVPRQRRSADLHDAPVLIVVGSIDAPSLPAEERIIPFEQRIFIGAAKKPTRVKAERHGSCGIA